MNYHLKGIIDIAFGGVLRKKETYVAAQLIEELAKCNYKALDETFGSNSE